MIDAMSRVIERREVPRLRAATRAVLGAACALTLLALAPTAALADDGTGAPVPGTQPPPPPAPGVVTQVSDEQAITRWAHPYNEARIFSRPAKRSKAAGRLRLMTEDGFPEVYIVLSKTTDARGVEWVRVRIPARPNGRTGWVRRAALSSYRTVHTKLLIDRRRLRATLFKAGRKVFSARVGVGKGSTPTPRGHFWIREKFHVRNSPVYGTRAIGTSAYAPTLADWFNGGVIGLHGTNQPYLIPGRPSHGCIRFKNADIERLYKLVGLGTPIEIR
jgi:lipoprotein-anchoring transpeptidase ErfK/SrfK